MVITLTRARCRRTGSALDVARRRGRPRRTAPIAALAGLAVVVVGLSQGQAGSPVAAAGQERPAAGGAAAAMTTSLVTSLGTTQVTPNGSFLGGGFVRVYHSPTADRLLVTFNTSLSQPEGSCTDSAHAYLEYTADMEETGSRGVISCMGGVDGGSLLSGDSYYLVTVHREGDQVGWTVAAYDPVSWAQLVGVFQPVDYPREVDNDTMVAMVNGRLDVSSQYNASGTPPPLDTGAFDACP